jgi:photosystem II stability/assembly factor-like uncharacterized protein
MDTLAAVSFSDANNGTVVGQFGTILGTTDAGISWVTQSNAVTTRSLEDVSFSDADNGTAVGDERVILRTTS